ncbi:hypothetical protein PSHT_02347 [Puccinia striiformis]|uniref:Peptidase M13 N-terminal domain-containing protein n=1 Tax=Puccinia striiformis TaxID=27350 RepID=A0A2S4WI55_9BASI|nr:hypothetical protein PSHT_02347 [Puccinia striiformis]
MLPKKMNLIFALALARLLGSARGHFDSLTDVMHANVLEGLTDCHKSFASTSYGWAKTCVARIGSKLNLGPGITPTSEEEGSALQQEIHELLDEGSSFFGTVQEQPGWIVDEVPQVNYRRRKVIHRDLESRVKKLGAVFVSDIITTDPVDAEKILNWENNLLRTIDFSYKHRLISLETLRSLFAHPKALQKLAIRTMNHSPNFSTRGIYPNYTVRPNFESMAEYWELLYSVTTLRALDVKSQSLVTYFALADLLKGVLQDSENFTESRKWIETAKRISDHSFPNRLASWFENASKTENSPNKRNQSSGIDLRGLEDEVLKLVELFQMPLQMPGAEYQLVAIFQYICTFNSLDFINTHYGSSLFRKILTRDDDYHQFMNNLELVRNAISLKESLDNVFQYAGLISHGIFDNKERGLKLYPSWEQYYWKRIRSLSDQFTQLYADHINKGLQGRNAILDMILAKSSKEARNLEHTHRNFVSLFSVTNHQKSSSNWI